jgi:hypothetical protein
MKPGTSDVRDVRITSQLPQTHVGRVVLRPGFASANNLHYELLGALLSGNEWSSYNVAYKDTGVFGLIASCSADKAGDLATSSASRLHTLRSITDEQLVGAKNKLKQEVWKRYHGPCGAYEFARQIVATGRYVEPQAMMSKIDQIDRASLVKTASDALSGRGLFAVVGNCQAVPLVSK